MELYSDKTVRTMKYVTGWDLNGKRQREGFVNYARTWYTFDTETTLSHTKAQIIERNLAPHQVKSAVILYGFGRVDRDGNEITMISRTPEDFMRDLEKISNATRRGLTTIIYAHNLTFDFYQIYDLLRPELEMLGMLKTSIVRAWWRNIEFRCSYKLTGESLGSFTKMMLPRDEWKSTEWDYDKVRTNKTYLTPEELNYFHIDLISLYKSIILWGEKFQTTVQGMPLTKTGFTRRKAKSLLKPKGGATRETASYQRYREAYVALMEQCKLTVPMERAIHAAFCGGISTANPNKSRQQFEHCNSVDMASQYPWALLTQTFPMGEPVHYETMANLPTGSVRTIACAHFDNIRLRDGIAISPMMVVKGGTRHKSIGIAYDTMNRLQSAECLDVYVTDIDMDYITACYTWDRITYTDVWVWQASLLPDVYARFLLALYRDKTILKGATSPADVEQYFRSKIMLNSNYGMIATRPVRGNRMWLDSTCTTAELAGLAEESIDAYNETTKPWYYAWAPFVTAYARRHLANAIVACGDDALQVDTDSIKFTNEQQHMPYFDRVNAENEAHLAKVELLRKWKNGVLSPVSRDHIKFPIGAWDVEGDNIKYFMPVHAKMYCYENNDGSVHTCAAGIPTKDVLAQIERNAAIGIDHFASFARGLDIDIDISSKLIHTIITAQSGTINAPDGTTMSVSPVAYVLTPITYSEQVKRTTSPVLWAATTLLGRAAAVGYNDMTTEPVKQLVLLSMILGLPDNVALAFQGSDARLYELAQTALRIAARRADATGYDNALEILRVLKTTINDSDVI